MKLALWSIAEASIVEWRAQNALEGCVRALSAIDEAQRAGHGPHFTYKLLVDCFGHVRICHRVADVVYGMDVRHPAALLAVEACKKQEEVHYDGCGMLLTCAASLLRGVHAKTLADSAIGSSVQQGNKWSARWMPGALISAIRTVTTKALQRLQYHSCTVPVYGECGWRTMRLQIALAIARTEVRLCSPTPCMRRLLL